MHHPDGTSWRTGLLSVNQCKPCTRQWTCPLSGNIGPVTHDPHFALIDEKTPCKLVFTDYRAHSSMDLPRESFGESIPSGKQELPRASPVLSESIEV